jgi:hypothetical protein
MEWKAPATSGYKARLGRLPLQAKDQARDGLTTPSGSHQPVAQTPRRGAGRGIGRGRDGNALQGRRCGGRSPASDAGRITSGLRADSGRCPPPRQPSMARPPRGGPRRGKRLIVVPNSRCPWFERKSRVDLRWARRFGDRWTCSTRTTDGICDIPLGADLTRPVPVRRGGRGGAARGLGQRRMCAGPTGEPL